METIQRRLIVAFLAIAGALRAESASAQRLLPTLLPEQRSIQVRDPSQLAKYRIRDSVPPPTVSSKEEITPFPVSLDDVIRTALERADVVRVLIGTTAQASGLTIYDAAVTNTTIDINNARFDPTLSVSNTWNRLESPQAIFDPLIPNQSLIAGIRNDSFTNSTNITKQNAFGGTTGFGFNSTNSELQPGTYPLNPQTNSSSNVNYTQPFLKGSRLGVNLAPIVIARINTELSYFQLKDSVQEMVRGVIEAYWALVAARTDVWARQQQIDQLTAVVQRIEASVKAQRVNRGDLSQVQVSLANARVILITSKANMIQREAALRNVLGLPPSDGTRLVPQTPPADERFQPDWAQILEIASERRPDLVELKLIIEADEQQRLVARNNALPQLDGVAMYRWNGLDGTMPNGAHLRSPSGAFTDWTLGINFSVPLGLRQSRALLRQRDLIIARDRINLQQGFHNAAHILATNIRSLDQNYELYLAYRDVREAAKTNLDYQLALYRTGTGILINVLQAVTDWGNAISGEASALSTYNTTLATLERQTGTILETHGVAFYEERMGSVGPLGRFCADVCYPQANRPTSNGQRYPTSNEASEEKFDLKRPVDFDAKPPEIDYNNIQLPTMEESLPDLPPEPSNEAPTSSKLQGRIDSQEQVPNDRLAKSKPRSSGGSLVSAKPKSWRLRALSWLPR